MSTTQLLLLFRISIRQVFEEGLRLNCGISMQVTQCVICFCRPVLLADKAFSKRGGISPSIQGGGRVSSDLRKVVYHQKDKQLQHCGGAVRGFQGRLGQTCFAVSVGLKFDLCKAVSCQQPLHQAMDWLSIARASAASTCGLLTRKCTALPRSSQSPG